MIHGMDFLEKYDIHLKDVSSIKKVLELENFSKLKIGLEGELQTWLHIESTSFDKTNWEFCKYGWKRIGGTKNEIYWGFEIGGHSPRLTYNPNSYMRLADWLEK